MPGLTNQLSGPEFESLLADIRALSGEPTLDQIRDVMVAHGISSPTAKDGRPSRMAATTLRDGPFARYLAKLESGRQTREALVSAAGAGVHPLDAIEEAVVLELQDHLTGAETVDVDWLSKQLVKLRTSISMREQTRRQQADLERKLRESEAKLSLAEQQERLREEQIAKLQAEARDREERAAQAKAAINQVKRKGGLSPEALARIEEAVAIL